MSYWRRLRTLLPSDRAARERDMQEELESLKAMAGRKELGNLTLVAENARAVWRWSWLETLWQDVRHSLRTLRKSPGFTITAVVVLGIGIGLNLTFFQLMNVAFLKPLPIRDAVACMGIFGVVSYNVALRRKEIGIRLALGALDRSIVALMVRQLIWPVSLAMIAGLIGGLAVGMTFASQGEFSPPEAPVVAGALLVLLASIGTACILPTLRALRSSDTRVLS